MNVHIDMCLPNGGYSTIPWYNVWKASSTQQQVLRKFCGVKMNASPFHLMVGFVEATRQCGQPY